MPAIDGNTFEGNRAQYGGGFATYMHFCDLSVVTNNAFIDNVAAYGGGIYGEEASCGEPGEGNTFSGNRFDDALY